MKKIIISALVAISLSFPSAVSAADNAQLISTSIFPDISLKEVSNSVLVNSVSDDSGVLLGGLGSDLYHVPGDDADTFYVITDRGPNNDTVLADKSSGTGFVVPNFSPIFMKIQLSGSTVNILETHALQTKSGNGTTGLPNIKGYDAVSTDVKGVPSASLYNLAGMDSEGIVKTKNGQYFIVDEYAPSLALLDKNGKILNRYVPQKWTGNPTEYKVTKSIPEIYLKRKANRGFEALALTPDGNTLFIGLQSPLLNPSKSIGDASLATRILRFDILTKRFTGEFVFGFETIKAVDPTSSKNSDLKVSAMVALDSDTLLVQERTDNSFLLSTYEVAESANILGSKWDLASTTPSLESYTGAGSNLEVETLIKESKKKIVFNSSTISTMPMKVEGAAVLDSQHVLFINDNDFNFKYNAITNKVEVGALKTSILKVKLAAPLPNYPEAAIAKYGKRCSAEGLKSGNLTCQAKGFDLRWRS